MEIYSIFPFSKAICDRTRKDPDCDPKLKALYYGRVIEIPTPRWTAYDAKFYELKNLLQDQMVTQERAYTSPIWYTP